MAARWPRKRMCVCGGGGVASVNTRRIACTPGTALSTLLSCSMPPKPCQQYTEMTRMGLGQVGVRPLTCHHARGRFRVANLGLGGRVPRPCRRSTAWATAPHHARRTALHRASSTLCGEPTKPRGRGSNGTAPVRPGCPRQRCPSPPEQPLTAWVAMARSRAAQLSPVASCQRRCCTSLHAKAACSKSP